MDTLVEHFRLSFEQYQQKHAGVDRAAYLAGYKAALGHLAGSAQAAAAAASGLIMAICARIR